MAHVLTTEEKATQRKNGQWSRTLLAVPEYHVIYSARLETVPTSNDMVAEIDFISGVGTIADILPDMTLYVGTSAGAYDLGMCRVRKAPLDDCADGTLYVGETSEIDWQANAYLTVVDDYSLWQKTLRVVSSEAYMDWDVDYSDQHEDFDPVPAMGTHRVKRISGASVNVTLGPSADVPAWVHGSTISSRAWSVDGATLDDSTAVNPVGTFTAAGTYLAYCTFTAANGKTFTGVRYVIIYDDDHPLIEDFTISSGRGSWEGGGYSYDVDLYVGTERANLRERSLVILCTEDYAERAAVTLPGQITGAENIICVGWISDIDSERDSETDAVSFTVESAEYWLKQIRDYPSGLELKVGTPDKWTDMPSMTVDRALWHFLHWRSTATRVMDIQLTGSTKLSTRFQTARANLWERLVQVAEPTIFAKPFVDNFGRLFVAIEPQMVAEDDRDFPVVMTITDDDIEGGISWTRRDVTPLSMLFFSGIAVDPSGSASSYFSMSPGHAYSHFGEEEPQDNYLVSSQADSNSLCGLYFGWRNGSPDNLQVTFAHSMRIVGIAPRQYFYFEISQADDPRGIGFSGNLIPREIQFQTDPDNKFLQFGVTFEPETFGGLAIDGDIPTMEDIDFSIPDLPDLPGLPALPTLPIISLPPSITNENHPTNVVIATSQGVFYTKTFNEDSPVWYAMNNGIATGDKSKISKVIVTPSGAIYLFCWSGTYDEGVIYRASGMGGVFSVYARGSALNGGSNIMAFGYNPLAAEQVAFVSTVNGAPFVFDTHFHVGTAAGYGDVSGAISVHMGFSGDIICYAGNWYLSASYGGAFATAHMWKLTNAGTYSADASVPHGSSYERHMLTLPDKILCWSWGSPYTEVSPALGMTPNTFYPFEFYQGMAFSPTGQLALAGQSAFGVPPYQTTDSGATWSSAGGTIPSGSDVWENCRDENRWLFGGGMVLRLTLDHGATYIDKVGNLLTIAPLVDIAAIRYIS